MAQNISLWGANYPDVPAVTLPKTGGGSAVFVDGNVVESIENAIAITVDGDSAPQAISQKQYIFLKNNTYLPDGAYKAKVNIVVGGTINDQTIEDVPDGVANALKDIADSLYTKITQYNSGSIQTGTAAFSISRSTCCKKGNVATISLGGTASGMSGAGITFADIPAGFRPPANIRSWLWCDYAGSGFTFRPCVIRTDGGIYLDPIGGGTVSGTVILLPVSYGVE